MPSLRGRSRAIRAALVVIAAVCFHGAAHAQEFINSMATGEPPETTYVRMAMFPRASLRMSDAELLAHLDAVKSAGATDVALDIWDMGTVPYQGSDLADPDSSLLGRDPLAVLSKGCYDRSLRCWLWPSAGMEVWRTPLAAKQNVGPFLRSRPTWAAVDRDGQVGYADSLAGVRRYRLSPMIRDVHQFLLKTFIEAIGRYPVAGVLLDGLGLASLDYSFDSASNQLYQLQYDPVDARGLTPADTVEWANWYTFRNLQTRPLVTGLTKNLRKGGPTGPTTALIMYASPERWQHVQDLPYWNKRAAISWVMVRQTPQTAANLTAALDSTMRELKHSTPDTRRPPGLGLLLDATAPEASLRAQVAALASVGGVILAAPEDAIVAAPAKWKSIWTALESMKKAEVAPAAASETPKPAKPAAKGKRTGSSKAKKK